MIADSVFLSVFGADMGRAVHITSYVHRKWATRPNWCDVLAAAGPTLVRMTLSSGIPIDELDPGIRPQDDLFRHVNGRWLARTEIPADVRATARSGFWLTRPRTRCARPWKRPGVAGLPETGRR